MSSSHRNDHGLLIRLVVVLGLAVTGIGILQLEHYSQAEVTDQQGEYPEITVSVAVTNKGNPIPGLSREVFNINDGKASLEITSFMNQEEPSSLP